MERVLYNTILGAWPIQADGTSFYYSDYAIPGRKVWYKDKWPCCSGTSPQLAADYHVSTYLRSADGVYVNLFTPSSVRWTEGAAHCALTQETNYPFDNTVTIKMSASRDPPSGAQCVLLDQAAVKPKRQRVAGSVHRAVEVVGEIHGVRDESIQTIISPIPRFPQVAYGTAVSGTVFGFDTSAG